MTNLPQCHADLGQAQRFKSPTTRLKEGFSDSEATPFLLVCSKVGTWQFYPSPCSVYMDSWPAAHPQRWRINRQIEQRDVVRQCVVGMAATMSGASVVRLTIRLT